MHNAAYIDLLDLGVFTAAFALAHCVEDLYFE